MLDLFIIIHSVQLQIPFIIMKHNSREGGMSAIAGGDHGIYKNKTECHQDDKSLIISLFV